MTRLLIALRRARRGVLARRRSLAALCAALAVLAFLRAGATPPAPRVQVLTAAHDLAAGVVLRPDDVRRTAYLPGTVPTGALSAGAAVGRTTTGPVRAGEALTDARLVTAALLRGYPGLSAVPVRIGDAGAAALLRVGDHVDLWAADPQGDSPAQVVGHDVPVLAIPHATDDGSAAPTDGALVVLGLPEGSVRPVAQAAVSSFLSVVLTR